MPSLGGLRFSVRYRQFTFGKQKCTSTVNTDSDEARRPVFFLPAFARLILK